MRSHGPLHVHNAVSIKTLVGIVTDTRNRLVLIVGKNRIQVEEGRRLPVLGGGAHVDLVLASAQTEISRPGLAADLTRVGRHAQHHLLRRHVLDGERLLLRTCLVGTHDLDQSSGARLDLKREGALVRLTRHRHGHRERGGRNRRRGSARHTASGSIEGQTRGKSGSERATSEFLDIGTDVHVIVLGVDGEGAGDERHGSGNHLGAHQGLHLRRVNLGRTDGAVESQAVGLVGLGVVVAVEHLEGTRRVGGVSRGKHGGVGARGAHRTGQRELTGSLGDVGVGPHSQHVDMSARTSQLVGHGGGKNRRRSIVVAGLAEIEDARRSSTTRGSERHVVGVDVTVRVISVGSAGGQSSHERVELDGVLTHRREVELDSKHVVGGRDFASGTDHTVELVLRETTVGRSRGRDSAVSHVVTEHFHAVHVHHDTVAVVHVVLVGSHVRKTSERLAEVLRARSGRRRAQRHGVPTALAEIHRVPVGSDRRRRSEHLPLHILHDGIVERNGEQFLYSLDHEVLEHHVTVDTSNTHPSAIGPGITT